MGHSWASYQKSNPEKKIEQETRILASINFFSINKIVLQLEVFLLSISDANNFLYGEAERNFRIKMDPANEGESGDITANIMPSPKALVLSKYTKK